MDGEVLRRLIREADDGGVRVRDLFGRTGTATAMLRSAFFSSAVMDRRFRVGFASGSLSATAAFFRGERRGEERAVGADAPSICSTSVNALISAWRRPISLWRSAIACAMSLMGHGELPACLTGSANSRTTAASRFSRSASSSGRCSSPTRWWRPTTGSSAERTAKPPGPAKRSSGTRRPQFASRSGHSPLWGTAPIGARDTGEALDAVTADGPGWQGLGDLCRQGGRAREHGRVGSLGGAAGVASCRPDGQHSGPQGNRQRGAAPHGYARSAPAGLAGGNPELPRRP